MQPLIKLLEACPFDATSDFDLSRITISSLAYDSRQVTAGSLFIAIQGGQSNGADYIDDAVANGAAALIIAPDVALPSSAMRVPVIRAQNPRHALAKLAAAFYPRQPETIAAITGTDGKTSTAHFLRQIWQALGYQAASVGTLGFLGKDDVKLTEGTHTTPDPIKLHQQLQQLATQGYTHIAIEASSHGLDQHRLDGLRLCAAAYTNLSREHLDYHGDMEHYFQAKSRLFAELLPAHSTAVINVEDMYASQLIAIARAQHLEVVEYGEEAKLLRVLSITPRPDGQAVELLIHGKPHHLHIPLVGNFQIYNMLAAMGLAMAGGYSAEDILPILPTLNAVPGRLQRVAQTANGAGIYIDYAHTPAALEKALQALRPHTPGRLLVVFGAGGDRDKTKRPKMGAAAAGLSDAAIITDDNPRHEDPASIRQAILAACPDAEEIADRRQAITHAINMLTPGDNLLVAGKGHETMQIIGDEHVPFNDAEVILGVVG